MSARELPFQTLGELVRSAEAVRAERAIVEHYIRPRAKTLLSAKPKVGKSTTAFGIVKAIRTGQPFAGLETASNVGVIYLTEESSIAALETKANAVDLNMDDPGWCVLQRPTVFDRPWSDIVEGVRAYAARFKAEGGFDDLLVVVDTLGKWARFREGQEQDAGATREAVELLDPLTADGCAVLILTHSGWQEKRTRGSSAIEGEVDIVLHLEGERGTWTPRSLAYLGGRLDDGETPPRLALRLNDDGTFTGRAGSGAVQAVRVESALDVVRRRGEPATVADVAAELSVSERTARRYLSALVKSGELVREERIGGSGGGRTDIYRLSDGVSDRVSDRETTKRPAISAIGQPNGQPLGTPNDDRSLPVSDGEGAIGQADRYGWNGQKSSDRSAEGATGQKGERVILIPFEEWFPKDAQAEIRAWADTIPNPKLRERFLASRPVPAAAIADDPAAWGIADADDYVELLENDLTIGGRREELARLGVETVAEARAAYTARQAARERARRREER